MDKEPVIPPITALINFYASELYNEIVINQDSSGFWNKSMDIIFEMSLTNFKTSLINFAEAYSTDKEMYNYFLQLVTRVVCQPFANEALGIFGKSFDEMASDPAFGGGISYKAADLSKAQLVLLFFAVHRDQITLAHNEYVVLEAERRTEKRNKVRNQAK